MELKTEEIIKILLILGVLYLLFNCITTENFADQPQIITPDTEPSNSLVILKSNNEVYRLVKLTDLKDEYIQMFITKQMLPKDNYESIFKENNKTKIDEYYVSIQHKSFFDGQENAFSLPTPQYSQINQIKKMPIVIIPENKLETYTKGTSIESVNILNDRDKGLVFKTNPDEFLFWSNYHKMLFHSTYDNGQNYGPEIKGFTSTINSRKKINIELVKIENNNINLKLVKQSVDTFIYYTLSNENGVDFEWEI